MNKKENDLANGSFQPNSVDQLPVNHVDEIPPEEDGEMEDELDDSEKFNESKFCWSRLAILHLQSHIFIIPFRFARLHFVRQIVIALEIYGSHR